MGHSVQLIVGRGEAAAAFQKRWPMARLVGLQGGWVAIPLEDTLHHAIDARHPGGARPPGLDLSPFGLESELEEATSAGGGLAYVETEYFGGAGDQSAMAYRDGRQVVAPQRARGGAGPINQALRAIGVERTPENDEFDTIGLGERRSMDDYGPEGPRRLRDTNRETQGRPDEATAADKPGHLPIWIVLTVAAAATTLGLWFASR